MSARPFVPEPAICRLPWYLACVSRLRAAGIDYVSSTAISKELNVDASQIAKDLSYLNIKGKTRIGYDVVALEKGLIDFLGFHECHNAVMMGVGSLGKALMGDSGLSRYGLNIVAGFDVNPRLTGRLIEGRPVYPLDELCEQLPRLRAGIAIIAVPVEEAARVAAMCVDAGAKALWNFTPSRLTAAPGIAIQDTSIYAHLALIYNRLKGEAPTE